VVENDHRERGHLPMSRWRMSRENRAGFSIASQGDGWIDSSRGASRNQGRKQRDQDQ